jgi:hypothetical protein
MAAAKERKAVMKIVHFYIRLKNVSFSVLRGLLFASSALEISDLRLGLKEPITVAARSRA